MFLLIEIASCAPFEDSPALVAVSWMWVSTVLILPVAICVLFLVINCMYQSRRFHTKYEQEKRALDSLPENGIPYRTEKFRERYPPIFNGNLLSEYSSEPQFLGPAYFPGFSFYLYPTWSILDNVVEIRSYSACTIQTDQQLLTFGCERSFTVKIVKLTSSILNVIAVGFAAKPHPPWDLPGLGGNSIAYRSDNGILYCNGTKDDPGKFLRQGDEIRVSVEKANMGFTKFRWFVNGIEDFNKTRELPWNSLSVYPTIGVIGTAHFSVKFD